MGQRGMPWAVNPSFQVGIIISFHNNLSIFPGIDETGLDGRVSINIAGGNVFKHDRSYGGP